MTTKRTTDMYIELFSEQEQCLRTLANARNTTVEALVKALITKGLKELLTDETIDQAHAKERDRINKFLGRLR